MLAASGENNTRQERQIGRLPDELMIALEDSLKGAWDFAYFFIEAEDFHDNDPAFVGADNFGQEGNYTGDGIQGPKPMVRLLSKVFENQGNDRQPQADNPLVRRRPALSGSCNSCPSAQSRGTGSTG